MLFLITFISRKFLVCFVKKSYCQQKPEGVKLGGYFDIQNN
ncbi:hypothetical protein SAMD00020551_2076 [Mesobacillus selenatarsenatis SF-1]|uniref:Uncharacterized protein n=1 Tax=Mesobacillus selenatarsenatis (strain DSM 18680 / JCM 14380 / FERM P-15431 / SF-1) TaxID=1321606 RepID=A0A0A8X3Y3_MESS1|nr:hypothetical protein SAMD00020551_2076 [Mesobacillus selenatarsenatis SF-1]